MDNSLIAQVILSYLEDFESGDVQHADEILPLVLRLQRLVAATDQPQKHSCVDGLRQGSH